MFARGADGCLVVDGSRGSGSVLAGREGNALSGNPSMNERGKSDSPVVPTKPPNKPGRPGAEVVEERGLPEGNAASKRAPDTEPE